MSTETLTAPAEAPCPGSARVSRAGRGVSPRRTPIPDNFMSTDTLTTEAREKLTKKALTADHK